MNLFQIVIEFVAGMRPNGTNLWLRRQMIEPSMDVMTHNLKFANFVGTTGYGSAQCAASNDAISQPMHQRRDFTATELRIIKRCRGRGCGHANGEGVDMSDNPFAGLAYGLLRNTGENARGSGSGQGSGDGTPITNDQCSGTSWK